MPRDLPSLKAIRVFECAARHLNFTRAAEELFVTQGAVSRQIKLLEDELGHNLFRRDGPKIELTKLGEQYHHVLVKGLGIIKRGTRELRHQASNSSLSISVLPSFAAKWLVPKMVEFQNNNMDLELRVTASYQTVDFDRNPDIDAAIRFGKGGWGSNIYQERLICEQIFPVCSPQLAHGNIPLKTPEDLKNHALIHSTEPYDEWSRWFDQAGVEYQKNESGHTYSDALLLLQAAIDGQGVTLARSLLVAGDLKTGNLIRPFETSVPSLNCYYFVCAKGRENEDKIMKFLNWLRIEAGQTDSACIKSC